MARMTAEQMERFFERTRQGILLTVTSTGTATGVPIWFDWDGHVVRFFSGADAPKIATMEADPRIAILVTNDLDEPPMWVRFEGRAEIDHDADTKALAVDVLAPRYWDLSVPGYASVVKQWAEAPDALVTVRLTPETIRSSA